MCLVFFKQVLRRVIGTDRRNDKLICSGPEKELYDYQYLYQYSFEPFYCLQSAEKIVVPPWPDVDTL